MSEDIVQFRHWGKSRILPVTGMLRSPTRIMSMAIHFKEDGAIGDLPSLAFECKDSETNTYVHEISLATLTANLAKAGYRLVREDS